MRFRFRRFALLLLGTLFTALFIVLCGIKQQHNSSSSLARQNQDWRSDSDSPTDQDGRTKEDIEVRRLLLSGAADEDTTASNLLEDASAEMAPALMSLFPVGRFPPAMRGKGSGSDLTLNLAIVLIVSLLSIAILITAICCVIIVALALDSSSTRHHWSSQHSSTHTSDFFLPSWPHVAPKYHRLSPSPVYRTPGLAKLFKQQQEQRQRKLEQQQISVNDVPVDTPPLTDDEDYADDGTTAADVSQRLLQKGQCQAPPADWRHNSRRNGNWTMAPLRRYSFTSTSANICPN